MDDPFDKHPDDALDPHREVPVQTDNRPRPEDGAEPATQQHHDPRTDLEPEDGT